MRMDLSDLKNQSFLAIGTMSGTSLDGLDLALVRFSVSAAEKWSFELVKGHTVSYDSLPWRDTLRNAVHLPPEELNDISLKFSQFIQQEMHHFWRAEGSPSLDAIGSHGHTVFHEPARGITVQIGNTPLLAHGFSCPVVGDFRVDDVALGGEGAPLVPIADALLFAAYSHCTNIGGFSNTSCVIHGQRVAWDISPVNILLNALSEKKGCPFDDRGGWARSGTPIGPLVDALNALPYCTAKGPKSLAWEDVARTYLPMLVDYEKKHFVEDLLASVVEHAAQQMATAWLLGAPGPVLLTGGGVHNDFLWERLRYHSDRILVKAEKDTADFKEAIAFALLGLLRSKGKINVLSSVTGASRDHSAGRIFSN